MDTQTDGDKNRHLDNYRQVDIQIGKPIDTDRQTDRYKCVRFNRNKRRIRIQENI